MKKVISAILLTGLIASSISMKFDVSAEEYQNDGVAVYGTPVMDNSEDSWIEPEEYSVERLKDGIDTDIKGTFQLMWDKDNLYVFVKVKDSNVTTEGNGISNMDSVETYIDYEKGNGGYTGKKVQFGISNNGEFTDGDSSYKFMENGENKINIIHKKTEDGYILKYSVPISAVIGHSLEAGKIIGFDIQLNDNDGNSARKGAYGWIDEFNEAWQIVDNLGKVLLEAAPGMEVVSGVNDKSQLPNANGAVTASSSEEAIMFSGIMIVFAAAIVVISVVVVVVIVVIINNKKK